MLKTIDSELYSSLRKTIVFIKSILGKPEETITLEEHEEDEKKQEDIVHGVKGLVKFLHCGTTKAQSIISSGFYKGKACYTI